MSRIDNIKKYKEQQEINAENKAIQEQQTRETYIAQIRGLKPRIAELIETANACFENDLRIGWEGNAKTLYGKWDVCGFTADSTYHRVGFIVTRSNDKKTTANIGILAGGACGSWNFATNGEEVVAYDSKSFKEPLISHLKQFIEDFDDFEKYFYAYVDKITGSVTDASQQTIVSALYNIAKLQEQEKALKEKLAESGFIYLPSTNWEVTGLLKHCSVAYGILFDAEGNELGEVIDGTNGMIYGFTKFDEMDGSFFGKYFYKVDEGEFVRVGFGG